MLNGINYKNVFLVDAVGAFASAIGLVILINFFDGFGLPNLVLENLLIFPLVYCTYSGICYLIRPKNPKILLFIIAYSNTFYMLATLVVLYKNYSTLNWYAWVYFTLEICIIVFIVKVELQLAKQLKN